MSKDEFSAKDLKTIDSLIRNFTVIVAVAAISYLGLHSSFRAKNPEKKIAVEVSLDNPQIPCDALGNPTRNTSKPVVSLLDGAERNVASTALGAPKYPNFSNVSDAIKTKIAREKMMNSQVKTIQKVVRGKIPNAPRLHGVF